MGMILFLEDWERSNAVADIHTKNRSFVHMARLLKSMGVKNHMFMLALIDQRLRKIDPFSPSITIEEVALVMQECELNPWYFFREVARAPGQAGAPARMLEANRGNMATFWCFFNHVMQLLIQIRQTGKSFNSDILASGLMQIWCRDTQINLLTKDEKLRRANIQRLKDIWDALPRYMDLRGKNDANNTEMMSIRTHNNFYYTHLPQASEALAGNVGRGLTSPIFFVDEPPFQPNIHEALPAALAAGGQAREIAMEANAPYGTVLTTTAGKKDTKEGAFMYKLMNGMAPWTEGFYDARNQAHLYELIIANSRDKEVRVNITLNHTQMGKTNEWLREKIAASVATGDKADRDYFNRWTAGTATNPLSIKQLEVIRGSEREPLWQEFAEIGGYATRWFLPEHSFKERMRTEPSIVVFDTSEASGGDDISMRVTGLISGECFATATINNTNIITFSEWVATWLTRWDKTTMLIERRSTGSAVLDMLLLILPSKDIDPFKRLFNRIVNNPEEHKDLWEVVKEPMWRRPSEFLDRAKKYFGFATSGSGMTSRASLYGQVLSQAANNVGHLVYDKVTIDQVASLITKNGRVDHPSGEHDDMCFVGSTLVRTINGNRPIKDLKLGDLVLTREGYKPIVKLFRSKKEVITKYGVTGTPNHPFITPNGEVQFKDLKPETEVYVWNEKLSSIETRSITDTLTRKEYNTKSTSTDTTSGTYHQSHSTGKSTKTPTEQSLPDTTYTTRTIITPTTALTILKPCQPANTCDVTTLPEIIIPKQSVNDAAKFWQNGIEKIKMWPAKSPSRTATANLLNSLIGGIKIPNLLNKLTVKLERNLAERQTVYNLMVEDCHEYFVNDILVHNCISWILTHWFMTKATNLRHYGIDATQVLVQVREQVSLSPMDRLIQGQQQRLRVRMKELLDKLKEISGDAATRMYEHELRVIYTKLRVTENEKLSIDELISQAKEEKLRKRIENNVSSNRLSDGRTMERMAKAQMDSIKTTASPEMNRWGLMTRFI